MRYVLFANGSVGLDAARFLAARPEEIAALVLHPNEHARCADEIREALGIDRESVVDGSTLRDPGVVSRLSSLEPQIGLSVYFRYIFRKPMIDLFPQGIINLHPSLLPHCRGCYPNVWSIVTRAPAGVTMHHIDAKIDTGDIVSQETVEVAPEDTGASLYAKLEAASCCLFRSTWPKLVAGTASRTSQGPGGSLHRKRDVDEIDEIDLDRTYTGRDLIDLIRARTFAPHRGAYFRSGGRKIYVSLALEAVDEAESDTSATIEQARGLKSSIAP
ncbi:MAG: formyltransferase family protein [Myxococcota bacterium]